MSENLTKAEIEEVVKEIKSADHLCLFTVHGRLFITRLLAERETLTAERDKLRDGIAAMKEGVGVRIAGLEAERDELRTDCRNSQRATETNYTRAGYWETQHTDQVYEIIALEMDKDILQAERDDLRAVVEKQADHIERLHGATLPCVVCGKTVPGIGFMYCSVKCTAKAHGGEQSEAEDIIEDQPFRDLGH